MSSQVRESLHVSRAPTTCIVLGVAGWAVYLGDPAAGVGSIRVEYARRAWDGASSAILATTKAMSSNSGGEATNRAGLSLEGAEAVTLCSVDGRCEGAEDGERYAEHHR